MGTTALVSDSSCSLTAREAAALGVGLVPLHVTLRDRRAPEPEIDPRDFYARLRAGDTATTSQPSPEEFLTAFAAAAAGGAEHVLCLTCASTMSGTHASALLAAGLAEVAVDVVDSGTISGGLRLLVVEASRALAAGESGEEVLALVTSLTGRVRSTWSADSPALLAGGGHLAADVPDGVALLGLDGEVVVLGSARTMAESVRRQAELLRAAAAGSPTRVTVGHGDAPDLADALAAALEGAPGVLEIDRYVVGPAVGAHAGPGSVGASYLTAPPLLVDGA